MKRIDKLLVLPCTIKRVVVADESDAYGEQAETVTEVSSYCWIDQHHSREGKAGMPPDQQEVQQDIWLGFFLADVALTALDRVTVQGTTYEVSGVPWAITDPFTGDVHHVEATLIHTA